MPQKKMSPDAKDEIDLQLQRGWDMLADREARQKQVAEREAAAALLLHLPKAEAEEEVDWDNVPSARACL